MIVLFEGRDTAGKIAFFDCTCFGRAGVERVMGSCKPLEYLEFLRQSPAMERMLDRWDDYTEAKKAMFFHTDTADAPWTVIKSDDKKRARINCMRCPIRTRIPRWPVSRMTSWSGRRRV